MGSDDRDVQGRRASEIDMLQLLSEVSRALKALHQRPGRTFFVVLTLGLGMSGALTTLNLLGPTLERPPVPDLERLVRIELPSLVESDPREFVESPVSVVSRIRQVTRLVDVAAVTPSGEQVLTTGSVSLPMQAAFVSREYFRTLGAVAPLGRVFVAGTGAPEAVLSHSAWHRMFSSDPEVIGRVVSVDRLPYTIVGVMTAGFWFPPRNVDVWLTYGDRQATRGSAQFVGRLAPTATVSEARAEFVTIFARSLSPPIRDQLRLTSVPEDLAGRSGVKIATIAVPISVLVLSCVDVGHLLAVNMLARRRRVAVMLALGARPTDIVRESTFEALLMALAGAGVGAIVASFATQGLANFLPPHLAEAVHDNYRMWLLTIGFVIAVPVTATAAPLIAITHVNVGAALRSGAQQAGREKGNYRASDLLVISEVALATGLVIASTTLARFVWTFQHVDWPSESSGLYAANVVGGRVTDPQLIGRLKDGVRSRLGLGELAISSQLPVLAGGFSPITIDDAPPTRIEVMGEIITTPVAIEVGVTPEYFNLTRQFLLTGRAFDDHDGRSAPRVAVVSAAFAELYWPHRSPLGATVRFRDEPKRMVTITGVVANPWTSTHLALPPLFIYMPYDQVPVTDSVYLLFRWPGAPPAHGFQLVRESVYQADRSFALKDLRLFTAAVRDQWAGQNVLVAILGYAAALALLLATFGVYGVAQASVLDRQRELAIRVSLGAGRRALLWPVVREGLSLGIVGSVLGAVFSIGIARYTWAALLMLSLRDRMVWMTVFGISSIALVAFYEPARRAWRVDPNELLRE